MSQQINLLGRSNRPKRPGLDSAAIIAGVVIGTAVLTAIYGAWESTQLTQVERQARGIAKAYTEAKAKTDSAAGTPKKPDASLEAKLAELTTELKARQEVIEALKTGTVGAKSGFSEYLRALSRQRVEGVWLTGFDIAAGGTDLTIAGRAMSADLLPTYLKRLNQEPPMQGRQFASVVINRPAPRVAAGPMDAKDAKEAPVVVPPYLEFTISSGDRDARDKGKTP